MIAFKASATASNFNHAFVTKTVDDIKTGKLTLRKLDGDPLQVLDVQDQINENTNKLITELALNNTDQIGLSEISKDQFLRVAGGVGNVTLDSTPFSTTPRDGTKLVIVGHSNANSVKIEYADIDEGCLLNGDATLQKGFSLVLIYDDILKRYIELSRNF